MRELELIEALSAVFAPPGAGHVLRGIGDDAAVVRGRGYAVTSLDAMVDGIHFRSGQLSAEDIGHRALAAALSDLAAMGAEPGEAYLLLGLPDGGAAADPLAIARGAQELAARLGVRIAGGDVTRAASLTVSFTVVGWTEDPGLLCARDGALPGDLVVVTGTLGAAGAGLALLDRPDADPPAGSAAQALIARYARPAPRLAEGRALARGGARAMIDLSDGIATDARHLATRSRVRIELSLAALPLADGVREVAMALGTDPRVLAATAGEDYELCACLAPASLEAAHTALDRLTPVGRVVDGPAGVVFTDADAGQELSGYEH